MSSMARARRATPSGPSRYATLGNSTASFIVCASERRFGWESADGRVSLVISVYQGEVLQASRHQERLTADVVAVRRAEEIDGARGLGWCAAASKRDHLAHRGDPRSLHSHADLATLDLDRARFSLRERLCETRLDVAERHAVDGHVVAAPLLRERLGDADHRGLAGRVVHLAGVAVGTGSRRDVDHLAHDAAAGTLLGLDGGTKEVGEGAQDAERRRQVDVEDRVPLL